MTVGNNVLVHAIGSSATRSEASGRRSWTRSFVLGALALATFAATLEVGARIQSMATGAPYDSDVAEREMRDLVARMNASIRTQGQSAHADERAAPVQDGIELHPYLGFAPSIDPTLVADGRKYFVSRNGARAFDVLVVGGSVSAGFVEHGWATFVAGLRESPRFSDVPMRAFCRASGGYKEPQQVVDVAYLFGLGYRPDLVLNIDGFNEAALASHNVLAGASPAHPSVPHWAHVAGGPALDRAALDELAAMRGAQLDAQDALESALAWRLFASAFTGRLTTARIRRLHARYVEHYDAYAASRAATSGAAVNGPPPPNDYDAAMEIALETWAESSRSIAAMCRERGIIYVHVLQPTLHDQGSKPLTDAEREIAHAPNGWVRGVQWAYPRMRECAADLGARGVAFVDASMLFSGFRGTLYYDDCHFDGEGYALLARLVAREVIALFDARIAGGGESAPSVTSPYDGEPPAWRRSARRTQGASGD